MPTKLGSKLWRWSLAACCALTFASCSTESDTTPPLGHPTGGSEASGGIGGKPTETGGLGGSGAASGGSGPEGGSSLFGGAGGFAGTCPEGGAGGFGPIGGAGGLGGAGGVGGAGGSSQVSCGTGTTVSQAIRMDYFGYRPGDSKVAIFSAEPAPYVALCDSANQPVFVVPYDGGSIDSKGNDAPASGDDVWWVDFSGFNVPGNYRLYSPTLDGAPTLDRSYEFSIDQHIYNSVGLAALKTFYYQRCNTPKPATYAGVWSDPISCHDGDATLSAAPGETDYGPKNLTGGWHDAGDYNKYVWGAVVGAILPMLRAYEHHPQVFQDGDLNIPESGNGVPDILDEIRWELDWLVKMQLPDGSVLRRVRCDPWSWNSPPSADLGPRYYFEPDLTSGAVFTGIMALAARVYGDAGYALYSADLSSAALTSWTWLYNQPVDDLTKLWAAAEVFHLTGSAEAKAYVDGFYPLNWQGRVFWPLGGDTQAAFTYARAPGADPTVISHMKAAIAARVNYLFDQNDLYRNGMPESGYIWGSNGGRAARGLFLINAARLGATGGHSELECWAHAQDLLHFFHGQNTLRMTYLSNMAALGGEHSSFQFYHGWFGTPGFPYSAANYVGKPASIDEPDYPYFKGVDNYGIDDNKTSTFGPAPGFVPGGPNKYYSGVIDPPLGCSFYNDCYRDWADQTVFEAYSWEISESSIGSQGGYVALASYFMNPPAAGLFLQKEVDRPVVAAGETATFRLEYLNPKSTPVHNVVIQDAFSAGLTVQSSNPSGTDLGAGLYEWPLGSLAPGQGGSIEITALVNVGAASSETNQAKIMATGQPDQWSNAVQLRTIFNPCDEPTLTDNGNWKIAAEHGFRSYGTSNCSQGAGCLHLNIVDLDGDQSSYFFLYDFAPGDWCAYQNGYLVMDVYSDSDPDFQIHLAAQSAPAGLFWVPITVVPGAVTQAQMNLDIALELDFSGAIDPCQDPLTGLIIMFGGMPAQQVYIDNIRLMNSPPGP